jgi:hypothetical protein
VIDASRSLDAYIDASRSLDAYIDASRSLDAYIDASRSLDASAALRDKLGGTVDLSTLCPLNAALLSAVPL